MSKIKKFHIAMWCMYAASAILSALIWISIPLNWSMMSATIMLTCEMVIAVAFIIVLHMYHNFEKEILVNRIKELEVC